MKTLKSMLCYKDLRRPVDRTVSTKPGTYRCLNCSCCPDIIADNSDKFRHPVSGRTYSFNLSTTCITSNVVYLATCVKCTSFYVEKTTRKLKEHIIEHKSEIRRAVDSNALYKHIAKSGIEHGFCFRIIDVMQPTARGGDNNNLLELKEYEWILRLDSDHFPGLNNMITLKPVLTKLQHTRLR